MSEIEQLRIIPTNKDYAERFLNGETINDITITSNDILVVPEYKRISITADSSNLVTSTLNNESTGYDKFFLDTYNCKNKYELTFPALTEDLIKGKKLEIHIYDNNTSVIAAKKGYVCTAILLGDVSGYYPSQIGRAMFCSLTYGICEAFVCSQAEGKLTIYESGANKLMFGTGYVVDIKVM